MLRCNPAPEPHFIGFDRRSVQADEGFRGTFADKQSGPSDVIRRQKCVGGSLREGHLITGQTINVALNMRTNLAERRERSC